MPPPVTPQPPTPQPGPESPGAQVDPRQLHQCEPRGDPLLWAWPSGLGDGSGGSRQWGAPGGGSPGSKPRPDGWSPGKVMMKSGVAL
eukprot:821372-Prorocentrum_lima.AAC.1